MLEPGRSRAFALACDRRRCSSSRRSSRAGTVAHGWRPAERGRPRRLTLVRVIAMVLFRSPLRERGRPAGLQRPGRDGGGQLLSALRNLGLGLAAMAHRPAYARLSALVSLFLVTVASAVGGEARDGRPRAGRRLRGRRHALADAGLLEGARPDGRRGPVVAPAADLGRGLGAGGRRRRSRRSRRSGRRGRPPCWRAWCPPRAARIGATPTPGRASATATTRSAASEHPESVGFTESEVYLETDRPSLYDSFNETYGEPFKPKKTERMIALGQQDVERAEGAAQREPPGRPRVLRRPAQAGAAPSAPGRAGGQGPGLRQGPDPAAPRPDDVQPLRRHGLARRALLQPDSCPPKRRPRAHG